MPVVSRLMSVTEIEFLRMLPKAIEPLSFSMKENTVIVPIATGSVSIFFHIVSQRALGSLVLPMMQVDIRFDNLDEMNASRFLDRFDRAFHRGGG
jgi:hypothetical protein